MSEPTKSESLQLPTELIDQILYFLEAQPDHFAASQVSKQWSKVAVPYVWRRIAPKQADTLRRLVTTVILNGNPLSPVMRFDGNFNFVKELDLENLSLFNAEGRLFDVIFNEGAVSEEAFSKIDEAPGPFCVKELSLNHCLITDAVLRRLHAFCPTLRSISLLGCVDLTAPALTRFLMNVRRLVKLDLSWNKNVDDEVIAHAAPCCQELQNVSLSGTAITDFGLLDLSTHCKQLRSLKLDVVPNITPHGVYKLAVDCVHLEQLSLMNCDGLLGSRIQQLSLMLHQENARESIEFRSKDEIRKIAELGQQDTW
ncbi:F-box and leucine-rich repeat protein 4 [Borealophlyctis nickersoniae]|nr:F-box and leucine-rich repeat protein 4 [Borealophlyctis nickersoniae]